MSGARWRLLAWSLAAVWTAAADGRSHAARADQGDPASPPAGLAFRLSEAADETPAAATPRPRPAPATALTDAEAQAILDQLPPLESGAAEPVRFDVRPGPVPPPRTGRVVQAPFPPISDEKRPEAVAAALRVVRHAPEGDVGLTPYLSVTFSQPMVAVTSQPDPEGRSVPVRLTPQPEGRWRWLGTQTLLFEPTPRFPMATDYQVAIPAGARSATGGILAAAQTWSFRTPPPELVRSYPHAQPGASHEAPLVAVFDQRVDPEEVLRHLRVEAAGAVQRVRLARPEEVRADERAREMWDKAPAGYAVALRTLSPLPSDADVVVKIAAGTPSAEGPTRTAEPQQWTFHTYGPLRIKAHGCVSKKECPPTAEWRIELTNRIDPDRFRPESVRVEPPVPGLRTRVEGTTLRLYGEWPGRTAYRVTLPAELADVHGQSLGSSESVTFEVTAAPARLWAPGDGLVLLDPTTASRRYPVYSVELAAISVAAYAVEPEDWPAFRTFAQLMTAGKPTKPPGTLVLSEEVAVRGRLEETTETSVDLTRILSRRRHVVVKVEPVSPPGVTLPSRMTVVCWIQSSGLGLAAFADQGQLVAWASALDDGRPLADVEIRLVPGEGRARTDARGLAVLPLTSRAAEAIVARRGDDVAVLPASPRGWYHAEKWERQEATDRLVWHVFDDRQLYRPGEEVRLKGWIRLAGGGQTGDVGPLRGVGSVVRYVLEDPEGSELAHGETPLDSAFGAFDLSLKLPSEMSLGWAHLTLEADAPERKDREHRHAFQVEEFRRPEFEVGAEVGSGPHFVGGHATVTARAAYYAGGPLRDADVHWQVSASSTSFTPPNRDGFSFGPWAPWWQPSVRDDWHQQTFQGRTDASGRHRLRIDLDSARLPYPSRVQAVASIQDVNRQTWSATVPLLVHPADLYVGLRSERAFVQQGQPLHVEAIVTDLDGRAVAGRPIAVRAERMEWEQRRGEWAERGLDAQDCAVTSSAEPVRCTLTSREGGSYRLTATVSDDQARRSQTELRVWVAGARTIARGVSADSVSLVPDKKEYRPGDTAEILVVSPFTPAEGLLTLRRSGIVRAERFTMSTPSYTLRVPIEKGWIPNVHVHVDLIGATSREKAERVRDPRLPRRPAYGAGELDLSIPPYDRSLAVTVSARESTIRPGGQTSLNVAVRDAANRPAAGAEAVVVVADEAILDLVGYSIPDPLQTFYAHRGEDTTDHHLRRQLFLGESTELPGGMMEQVQVMASSATTTTSIGQPAMRTDFSPLALFAARIRTDAEGRAVVPVVLPHNVTRYRITAVAATPGAEFGKGESALTARLPLMARPSPPRFMNFGDEAELPVVVQNQTDGPLAVDVALRSDNLAPAGAQGLRAIVPARDRIEVRFPVKTIRPGSARVQVAAVSEGDTDAAEVRVPIWSPATTEAFATYGQIDAGHAVQPIAAPHDVVPQFGGLEITTSATALQSLTDAVAYLVSYPFECAEQISSRVLAIAALRDVLAAFAAAGLPDADALALSVRRDVARLSSLQNDDGGFGFWGRGEPSRPYLSIHAAHALQRAREKGFPVPDRVWEEARDYLRHVPDQASLDDGADVRRTLIAYALYVRQRMGDPDPAAARALIAEAGPSGLSFEALGWLLAALSPDPGSAAQLETIRAHFVRHVAETAGAAHFADAYEDKGHVLLGSERRADAIVLEALIADQPRSDLIPKLVQGLLGHRKSGRWSSTQENVFVLLALDRYFREYERITPDFTARTWLGPAYAGEQSFRGRTTERHRLDVPMSELIARPESTDVILSKEGAGRLYYRIGMTYAPASLRLEPADLGFTVQRRYEGADTRSDVRRAPDGTWHVRAGARVRVHVTMAAPAVRHHVALVDPLPAGLEALNPELDATAAASDEEEEGDETPRPWSRWRRWFEHQNLRDERAEAFTSALEEGVYTFSYLARATTPGRFVAPPPRAEEMYAPETFGRGSTDFVIVEEP